MEQICENNNFKLLLTGWDNEINFLPAMHKSKYYLHPHMRGCWWETSIGDRTNLTAICGHPNEDGYEIISRINFLMDSKISYLYKNTFSKRIRVGMVRRKDRYNYTRSKMGIKRCYINEKCYNTNS